MDTPSNWMDYDTVEAKRCDWDAAALWPGLPIRAIRLAQVRLAAIVRAVLAPSASVPAIEAADEVELAATGVAAFLCGVGPLFGYWIERGQLCADRPVARLFAEHLRQGRRRAVMFEEQLARLLAEFRRDGMIPIVFKGTVTARRHFPEPGTRPTSDIDLLIEPRRFAAAAAVMRRAGFVETAQTWKSTTWMLPEACRTVRSLEMDHAENPWSIDLHHSVDYQYFRGVWARYGDLPWSHAKGDAVAGHEVRCFAQPLLAAHLAQHASLLSQHLRLIRVVELVLVLRHDLASGTLDWNSLSELLSGSGLWRFVYPAFESAERLAPGLLDPRFRQQLSASATSGTRRIVERAAADGWGGWTDPGLQRVAEHLAWSRGLRELALNVLHLAFPAGLPVRRHLACQTRRLRLLFQKAA
jgi:hypothetical protein